MILGYTISGPDNDSYLYPNGHGKSICEVLDYVNHRERYISDKFKIKQPFFHLSFTYDSAVIVSQKFKDFCTRNKYEGIEFHQLKIQKEMYLFKCLDEVKLDTGRREVKFEEFDEKCKMYNSISGAFPAFLNNRKEIPDGFFKSDIKFGTGYEQSSLIIIGVNTFNKMINENFTNIDFEKIIK